MSLWIKEEKKGRRTFYFTTPGPITAFVCIITLIPTLVILLAPAIRWLNRLFH